MIPTADDYSGDSALRRWGPIAAIVVVISIIVAVVALSDSDDSPSQKTFGFGEFCGIGTDITIYWNDGDMRLKCTNTSQSTAIGTESGVSGRTEELVDMSLEQFCDSIPGADYYPVIESGRLICRP